ncbi:hypothetical protein ACE6H2_006705 [Prunus campanulata]
MEKQTLALWGLSSAGVSFLLFNGRFQRLQGSLDHPCSSVDPSLITGFCQHQELESAFRMKLEMVKGVSPDAVTYSSLIHGVCRQRRLVEACDLFKEMLSMGMPPDEFTYTTLINAYCVEGDLNKALQLNDEMIQKGFLPDVVTYSVLINGLNKQARTREAKRLLLRLFYEESVPDGVTYNTLIENCTKGEFKSVVALVKRFCMKV